jgi:hypothetical protein
MTGWAAIELELIDVSVSGAARLAVEVQQQKQKQKQKSLVSRHDSAGKARLRAESRPERPSLFGPSCYAAASSSSSVMQLLLFTDVLLRNENRLKTVALWAQAMDRCRSIANLPRFLESGGTVQ